jgi:hypothetical protein
MTTVPENYNSIRAGIVELLKAARKTVSLNRRGCGCSSVASARQFNLWVLELGALGHSPQGNLARRNFNE